MEKSKKVRIKAKKRVSMGKLKERADSAVQDWYRRYYLNGVCEMCNARLFYCVHHFIEKSASNYLRYDRKNLVRVCKSCHSKFHKFIDPEYPIKLAQIRGSEWVQYIKDRRHLLKTDNRKELEGIIDYYENN